MAYLSAAERSAAIKAYISDSERSNTELAMANTIASHMQPTGWNVRALYPNHDVQAWALVWKQTTWEQKTGDSEAVVLVHYDVEAKRLRFSGMALTTDPTSKHYHSCGECITVSATRKPEAIAREITTRLLPVYLPALAEAHRRRSEAIAYVNEQQETMRVMLEAFNGREPAHETAETFGFYNEIAGYGDIQCSSKTVTLKLYSVPVAMALEIAAVFQKYATTKKAG